LRKLEAHNAAIRRVCQKLDIGCHTLSSDQPLELALFDFLRQRMQRGKKVKRFARSPGAAIDTK
jgi:hypothetical protein